jgi:hypothetical protein
MAAPVSSVATPRMLPNVDCARAAGEVQKKEKTARETAKNRRATFFMAVLVTSSIRKGTDESQYTPLSIKKVYGLA